MSTYQWTAILAITLVFIGGILTGCGWMADADRIVVARVGDEVIRREDLQNVLREMMPEERPIIRTRDDLLDVLEEHVDRKMKDKLVDIHEGSEEVHVPRELAAQRFDALFPEYRRYIMYGDQMELSPADVAFFETEREFRIDRMQRDMLGDAAIMFRLRQAVEAGELTVSEEELEEAYEERRDDLVNLETIVFDGIVFPGEVEGASTLATGAYERLREGEDVSALAAEYAAAGTGFPLSSELQNDPRTQDRFRTFWQQASGAEAGDILGPIAIRDWEVALIDDQNRVSSRPIPQAFLVCEVIESSPARPMTLDEARPLLEESVLYEKKKEQLYEEFGVEIYPEQLPDPAGFTEEGPRSVFDETPRHSPMQ